MADLWVMNSQNWINTTYSSVSGVPRLTEDGLTGWGTMYALTRALQHELGITTLSDTFGPATQSAYVSKVGSISRATKANIVGILQCALWCKGYTGGTKIGAWDDVISASLGNVRADIGLSSDGTVDVKLMKSLLTLDAYVLVGSGTQSIRAGQQWLNSRYTNRADFFIIPADGRFTRDVQKGLMLAIQYEIGMADGVANGALFGPGTQTGLRDQAMLSSGSTDGATRFVSLFQLALAFNGYDVTRTGTFAVSTRTAALDFQRFMEITATGSADFDTWAALLVSTGNANRAVTGMDTTTALTADSAAARYKEGYRVVGRYLTVEGKSIVAGELDAIFDAGFSMFPIFQNYNNGPQYFTRTLGLDHGRQAAVRARQLGFQSDVTIFFAVDYDAFETEIDTLIVPYFEGVRDGLASSVSVPYQVGIYATRNVAAKILDRGLASTVWVSGMSTGYSGNLGYPMPKNWSYNQIQEITLINIDRNAVSTRAQPATKSDVSIPPAHTKAAWNAQFELTRLQFIAEEAAATWKLIPPSGPSLHLLSFLMQRYYNSSEVGAEFAAGFAAYLPLPEHTGGDVGIQNKAVRGAINAAQHDVHVVLDNLPGDAAHAAATAQGVFQQGDHARSTTMGTGDLGGWALDLATFWRQYVLLGDPRPTVNAFTEEHLGVKDDANTFSEADLFADADGWLIGRLVRQGVSADEAYRRVYRDLVTPQARLRTFLEDRFGSQAALKTTIVNTFKTDSFIHWAAILAFLQFEAFPNDAQLQALATAAAERFYEAAGG